MYLAGTIRIADELLACYVACKFCQELKPTQDMELHLNVCSVWRQDDPGYAKPADLQRLLNPRAYRLQRVESKRKARQAEQQTARDADDSETLVDEEASAPLSAQWSNVSPDLADRFPIVEPPSPELRAMTRRPLPSPPQFKL